MPRIRSFTYTLATPDLNGICLDQTTGGAANLTINGASASGGTVTFTGGGYRVSAESAGDIQTVTFTITGTDPEGRAITDTITGVNASTVETTAYFKTVTQVAADGAVGTNVEIGHVDEFAAQMYPLDVYIDKTTCMVNVSGTVNLDVQALVQDPQTVTSDNQVWFDHVLLAGVTADSTGSYDQPIDAVRVITNSFSAGATIEFTVRQIAIR